MSLRIKMQNIQDKLVKRIGRRFHSSPLPIIFLKTGVIMVILVLMTTNSTYSMVDILILLLGAPILIYFILVGYKYLL